jgi:hypothetical protein
MTKQILTQDELKQYLHYEPSTGQFTRIKKVRGANLGEIAGGINKVGYNVISVKHKLYYAHRLAWLYMNGEWPNPHIDHINRVKHDNRFCNLRECNDLQNHKNSNKHRDNVSGYIGVSWCKEKKKWLAKATLDGKQKFLGRYDDISLAVQARHEFCKENYGAFYSGII